MTRTDDLALYYIHSNMLMQLHQELSKPVPPILHLIIYEQKTISNSINHRSCNSKQLYTAGVWNPKLVQRNLRTFACSLCKIKLCQHLPKILKDWLYVADLKMVQVYLDYDKKFMTLSYSKFLESGQRFTYILHTILVELLSKRSF